MKLNWTTLKFDKGKNLLTMMQKGSQGVRWWTEESKESSGVSGRRQFYRESLCGVQIRGYKFWGFTAKIKARGIDDGT